MSLVGASGVRLGWLVANAARQTLLSSLYASPLYRWRLGRREPERLLLAPQELRIADPTRAEEIVEGRYSFAGKTLDLADASPFLAQPPSPAWQEALLGFTWLRHLRASDGGAGRTAARRLIAEFVRGEVRYSPEALEPVTAARRLLAFLCQAPLLLDGVDRSFYRAFLRSLNWQANYLARIGPRVHDGMPRLLCAIAATQASLCLADSGRRHKRDAARFLARELTRQILPDGGHLSRNPQAVLDLLLDLLPLRQSFSVRHAVPPQELIGAIDRLMPMLRFFRHQDGALAAFNGMGYTQAHLVAAILSYDDGRGRPMQNAPHSGYQRVDAGGAVLILDAGRPPPMAVSQDACAGALSFEFSANKARIIVNCGSPGCGRDTWRQSSRATPAHSTATVGGRSSALFAARTSLPESLGRPLVAGPRRILVERKDEAQGVTLALHHDGYRRNFGLIHHRGLALDSATGALRGHDAFLTAAGSVWRGHETVTLRFHLHPQILILEGASRAEVILVLPNGMRWRFTSPSVDPVVEESVHFANPEGPRRSAQIALSLPAGSELTDGVPWSIEPLP